MGEALQKVASDKIRTILSKLTSSPLMGTVVGAAITSIIQSSSATTVLAVGFVNSGLMSFYQTLGIIFGANIGTTITSQFIAFKLTEYALPLLAIGLVLYLVCKNKSYKYFGLALFGFGTLFLGLNIMTTGVKPLADNEIFKTLFLNVNNNVVLAVLTGALVTALLQSSSVTTGIVLTLASLNLITLQGAIPLILGCNIGTCATALLASIGANRNARRTAVAHLLFNCCGTLLFLPFITQFTHLVQFSANDIARQCANAHTLFNIICTLLILPFTGLYSKLIIKLVKEKQLTDENDTDTRFLENHLLCTPPIAIQAATKEIIKTLELSKGMIKSVLEALIKNDSKFLENIEKREEIVDSRRYAITGYLVRLMESSALSHQESKKIPALLHVVNDVERIGDHAMNLKNLIKQKIENKLDFSEEASQELSTMYQELLIMIEDSILALQSNIVEDAKKIIVDEEKINIFRNLFKSNHINRLNQGQCKVLSGLVFIDIINNFEKIGDHLKNIGDAILDGLQWRR
jgi:phosphate:Na+ symporter